MNIKNLQRNPSLKTVSDFINEVNNQIFKIKNPEDILNRGGYFIQEDGSLLDPYYDINDIIKTYSALLWDMQLNNINIMSPLNYDKHSFHIFLGAKNISNEDIVNNIHNDLFKILKELKEIDNSNDKKNEIFKLSTIYFSKNDLVINNKQSISFKGKINQKLLLSIIADNKNINKELDFEDIEDELDSNRNNKKNTKKNHRFYNASKDINEELEKKLHIKNFLITTTKTVKINEMYLDINS